MLDSVLDHPVLYDQNGTPVGKSYVWTGSNANGTAAGLAPPGASYEVSSDGVGIFQPITMLGDASATDGTWLAAEAVYRSVTKPGGGLFTSTYAVYGISEVQTFVPEPATIVMWSLFAGVAGLVFWRKGRKSN